MALIPHSDHEAPGKLADAMGPGVIDHQLREAIRLCWIILPPHRRSIDQVENEIRRLLDRAFRNMREDQQQATQSK